LRDGFLAIPSGSIVGANISGNFDEAPVSVEFIYPNDPGHSLQVGSELRLTQAPTQAIPKPVYNLRFKTEAGPAKLRWNLFKYAPNAGE
jgi:hypothetical protein